MKKSSITFNAKNFSTQLLLIFFDWGLRNRVTSRGVDIPGVNFTNVLEAALMCSSPKSVKRYWQLNWIFTLSGSAHVKAAHIYVGEIDPWFLEDQSMKIKNKKVHVQDIGDVWLQFFVMSNRTSMLSLISINCR